MLEGKVALVTGSGRGIGKATAEQLAALGASVVINDIDADIAQQTADEIQGETAVHACNLLEEGAPEQLVQATVDAFGKLDIIVNNAGFTMDAPIHKMTDDAFRTILEIHTVVPFKIIRAAAPYFRDPAKAERERGEEVFRKIVNISSLASVGNAGQANYSAAKAGVIGLTRTMAKEWGSFKVNVNAVAFGVVETRLTAAKTAESTAKIGDLEVQVGIPEQQRAMFNMMIPLGRGATPKEAAGGIVFFCSPWSDYVTGQVLAVSGGLGVNMSA